MCTVEPGGLSFCAISWSGPNLGRQFRSQNFGKVLCTSLINASIETVTQFLDCFTVVDFYILQYRILKFRISLKENFTGHHFCFLPFRIALQSCTEWQVGSFWVMAIGVYLNKFIYPLQNICHISVTQIVPSFLLTYGKGIDQVL